MPRCCHLCKAPGSHRRSRWALAIFLYLFAFTPFPLARAGSGQAAFREPEVHQAEFLQPLQSGWHLFACQAGPLNSFVKVQLRDHSPVPGSLAVPLLACVRLRAEGVRVCLAAEGRSRRARGCLLLAAGPRLLLASRQGFWPPSSLAAAELSPRLHE